MKDSIDIFKRNPLNISTSERSGSTSICLHSTLCFLNAGSDRITEIVFDGNAKFKISNKNVRYFGCIII